MNDQRCKRRKKQSKIWTDLLNPYMNATQRPAASNYEYRINFKV